MRESQSFYYNRYVGGQGRGAESIHSQVGSVNELVDIKTTLIPKP